MHFRNLIGGQWAGCARTSRSINPSDTREQGRCAAEFYTMVKTACTFA